MTQSFSDSITALKQWQSSICMIPVVLGLLKEKLHHLDDPNKLHSESFQREIQAYHAIYQHWGKADHLNPKQQEWIQEMGNYLSALQQTIFGSSVKNPPSIQPHQKLLPEITYSIK